MSDEADQPSGGVELSLVVPAFNEAAHLSANIRAIHAYLTNLVSSFELIIADDGSTDETPAIARRLAVAMPGLALFRLERNAGKGAVLREAMRRTHGRIIGFLDADLEIPVHYIADLLAAVRDGADIAVGSKFIAGSGTQRVFWRNLAHHGYHRLETLLLGRALADDQCGIKLFAATALRPLLDLSRENGWAWDPEMMTLAMMHGFRIREIPITAHANRPSRVRPMHAMLTTLRGLFRLRRRGIFVR